MKKYLLLLIAIVFFLVAASLTWTFFVFKVTLSTNVICIKPRHPDKIITEALELLKKRNDSAALENFQTILDKAPDNIDALWGKAEVLRRRRNYKEAEEAFNRVLAQNPEHLPSLLGLAYLKQAGNNLDEALSLVKRVLSNQCVDNENAALAYVMLGTINNDKCVNQKGLFCKLKYGTSIKAYFLKASNLAPDLPEAHLALGTFYLLAPGFIGGNIDRAIAELQTALNLAPDFVTVNARLAQAYRRKGNLEKSDFYTNRAKHLDPENEVLKEIK